jgi:hypothetical protein
MNLRQLKYSVSVVDAGNMTRAAEQLHVAQTALGMQIRQIEEDLGVALLDPSATKQEASCLGWFNAARVLNVHLIYQALTKTGGNSNGDARIAAMKGVKWESPGGPIATDPERYHSKRVYSQGRNGEWSDVQR